MCRPIPSHFTSCSFVFDHLASDHSVLASCTSVPSHFVLRRLVSDSVLPRFVMFRVASCCVALCPASCSSVPSRFVLRRLVSDPVVPRFVMFRVVSCTSPRVVLCFVLFQVASCGSTRVGPCPASFRTVSCTVSCCVVLRFVPFRVTSCSVASSHVSFGAFPHQAVLCGFLCISTHQSKADSTSPLFIPNFPLLSP